MSKETDADVIQLEQIRTRLERAIQTGLKEDWYAVLENTPQDIEFLLEKVRKMELTMYYLGKDTEKYKRMLAGTSKPGRKPMNRATSEDHIAIQDTKEEIE